MKCLEKITRITIIRVFCSTESARKCPMSDNIRQNSCKIVLIRAFRKGCHLTVWLALSTTLCYIAEWQPIKFCWALSAANLPVHSTPRPRHWLWLASFWWYIQLRCHAVHFVLGDLVFDNHLDIDFMAPWHVLWNSASIHHHQNLRCCLVLQII